jgi:hypothetical protein
VTLLQKLETVLADPRYRREHPEHVDPAFARLTAEPCELLREFFRRFEGPLGSDVTGFTLLDIVRGGKESIVAVTELVRSQFGLGHDWIVISDLLANGVIIYNEKTMQCFDWISKADLNSSNAANWKPNGDR